MIEVKQLVSTNEYNKMVRLEAKPCPFCGNHIGLVLESRPDHKVRIMCPDCGSAGAERKQVWGEEAIIVENKAIKAWNRRI